MTRLHKAAARYCAAKDREREIVRSMKFCERIDGDDSEQDTYCSRCVLHVPPSGPYDPQDRPMPVEDWCQSCRDNLPAVEELRRVRRSLGGLASAMRRAARRERAKR